MLRSQYRGPGERRVLNVEPRAPDGQTDDVDVTRIADEVAVRHLRQTGSDEYQSE